MNKLIDDFIERLKDNLTCNECLYHQTYRENKKLFDLIDKTGKELKKQIKGDEK